MKLWLILITFAVDSSSFIAYVEKTRVALTFLVKSEECDGAKLQRMKSLFFRHLLKKPQNPSESGILQNHWVSRATNPTILIYHNLLSKCILSHLPSLKPGSRVCFCESVASLVPVLQRARKPHDRWRVLASSNSFDSSSSDSICMIRSSAFFV